MFENLCKITLHYWYVIYIYIIYKIIGKCHVVIDKLTY